MTYEIPYYDLSTLALMFEILGEYDDENDDSDHGGWDSGNSFGFRVLPPEFSAGSVGRASKIAGCIFQMFGSHLQVIQTFTAVQHSIHILLHDICDVLHLQNKVQINFIVKKSQFLTYNDKAANVIISFARMASVCPKSRNHVTLLKTDLVGVNNSQAFSNHQAPAEKLVNSFVNRNS